MAETDWEDINGDYEGDWEDVKSLALDTGGIGRPVSRDEARMIAGERVVKRARAAGQEDIVTGREIGHPEAAFATPTGVIPQAMAFSREFARNIPGSFSEPFLKGFEKLASAIGFEEAVKMFGKEGLERNAPTASSVGMAASIPAGGKAVAGSKLGRAQSGREFLKQGAVLGAGIGGSSQLSESISEGADPLETIGRTAWGAGAGALAGTAFSGIPAAAKLAGRITRKANSSQIMANLMNVDLNETGLIAKYGKGGLDDVPSLLKPHFKGSGIDGLQKAEQGFFDEATKIYQPIIKQADPNLLKPKDIYLLADKNLSKKIGTVTDRQELLSKYVKNFEEINSENLLTEAARANRNLRDFYRFSEGLDSDKEAALKAVRDTYSQLIGKILDQAQVPKEVYSNMGKVGEVVDNISENFYNKKFKYDSDIGGGVRGALTSNVEGLPHTKFQTLERLGRAATVPFKKLTGGEPSRINNQIDSMFKRSSVKENLTPSEKMAIETIRVQKEAEAARNKSQKQIDDILREEKIKRTTKEQIAADASKIEEAKRIASILGQTGGKFNYPKMPDPVIAERVWPSGSSREMVESEVGKRSWRDKEARRIITSEEAKKESKAIQSQRGTPSDLEKYLAQESKLKSDLYKSKMKEEAVDVAKKEITKHAGKEMSEINKEYAKSLKLKSPNQLLSDFWYNKRISNAKDAELRADLIHEQILNQIPKHTDNPELLKRLQEAAAAMN